MLFFSYIFYLNNYHYFPPTLLWSPHLLLLFPIPYCDHHIYYYCLVLNYCDHHVNYYHIYQPHRSGWIWHNVTFFKRRLTGLNSEFSFSYTSCLTKAEEPSLSYCLPIAGGRIIHTFPKGISAMWNAISLVQDLNSCNRIHFLRLITITPRAHPNYYYFPYVIVISTSVSIVYPTLMCSPHLLLLFPHLTVTTTFIIFPPYCEQHFYYYCSPYLSVITASIIIVFPYLTVIITSIIPLYLNIYHSPLPYISPHLLLLFSPPYWDHHIYYYCFLHLTVITTSIIIVSLTLLWSPHHYHCFYYLYCVFN